MAIWLYQFPSGGVIGAAVAISLLLCVGAPWVTRRLLRLDVDARWAAGALDALKLIGPLAGIFTVFLLLQSVNRLHDAHKLVESQAMNLLQLDRSLGRIEGTETAEARRALRDYARVLVDRGWPAMRTMQPSPDLDAAFSQLSNGIDTLTKVPAIQRRIIDPVLSDLEALGDMQAQITAAANGGLPAMFWFALGLLMLLMVAEAAMIEPRHSTVLPLAGYFAALGLLIGLLFLMDRPFVGEQSADPAPIERSIAILDLRAQLSARAGQGAVPAGVTTQH